MEKESQKLTDHEAILLITRDIAELKISQSDFHKEMRESIKDLQNNYSSRLDNCQTRINALEATKADFRQKLDDIKTWVQWFCAIGIILISILFYHLTGFHI